MQSKNTFEANSENQINQENEHMLLDTEAMRTSHTHSFHKRVTSVYGQHQNSEQKIETKRNDEIN